MSDIRKSEENRSPSAFGQAPKRMRPVWTWAELALLIFGMVFLSLYVAAWIERTISSRAALEKFATLELPVAAAHPHKARRADPPKAADAIRDLGSSRVDFSLWDQHRIEAYKEALWQQADMPLGVLRISKIHLEVPLLDGTDDLTLNHAVGRIAGTARPGEPGNIGIAGHRDGFFRGLKDIKTGDAIELKTLQGTNTYIVGEIHIVTPKDVSVLRPRAVPSITLVTCYPFYFIGSAPQRYIVTAFLSQGSKSEPEKFDPPAAISTLQLNKEEQ